jgi:acetolactate synthase-1/2/3 large subunit
MHAATTAPAAGLAPAAQFGDERAGLTVAQLLLEYLRLEEATKIFGIPGGALIFVIDELKKQSSVFDFFVCRQETGAAYIAHGYASVSGQLGVVLATSGPAATNALTGAVNAEAAGCSMLAITGEVPEKAFGKGYLQEGIDARLDIDAVYRNAVEYSAVISNQLNSATLIEQALRVARSQPSRAAHLSLPNDVAGTCVTGSDPSSPYRIWFPDTPDRYRAVPSGTDVDKVKRAFEDLTGATRPLLLLGNGARGALSDPQRLQRFTGLVEEYALPVTTTADAKGIFPESHALSLRNYGITACSWPDAYVRTPDDPDHFDALMVLGSSLGELATTVVNRDQYSKNLIPSRHFIHVDLDEGMIGRNFPVTRGIVADVGATIDALCEIAAGQHPDPSATSARRKLIEGIKRENAPFADPSGRASDGAPVHPAALVRVINESISSGHVFIDAGNCVGWSLNNLVVDPPLAFHSALDMGPMGFGVCAVIGGKIAAPDETCLAIVGDGAFMMHAAEISTAAQYQVGAIWVVLYDNDLAMVSQGMSQLFPPPGQWDGYYALGAPDLVKVAEGLGADAVAVTPEQGPADFEAALRTAVQNADERSRPQVIVVHIDPRPTPPYGWPAITPAVCSNGNS